MYDMLGEYHKLSIIPLEFLSIEMENPNSQNIGHLPGHFGHITEIIIHRKYKHTINNNFLSHLIRTKQISNHTKTYTLTIYILIYPTMYPTVASCH